MESFVRASSCFQGAIPHMFQRGFKICYVIIIPNFECSLQQQTVCSLTDHSLTTICSLTDC